MMGHICRTLESQLQLLLTGVLIFRAFVQLIRQRSYIKSYVPPEEKNKQTKNPHTFPISERKQKVIFLTWGNGSDFTMLFFNK